MSADAQKLLRLLKKKGKKVCFAESCTGGMLAESLTAVPGASEVLDVSFITYSNDAKCRFLGVNKTTIDGYGAVSSQCVEEMALGALLRSKADIVLSISGIAGPDGGSDEKPVGTVYFGLAEKKKETIHDKVNFDPTVNTREDIRKKSVHYAIDLLIERLSRDE